jgi:transcriptional regulator with XRE-family HTH domain
MNMNLKDRIASLAAGPKNKKTRIEVEKNLLAAKFLSEIQIQLEGEGLTRKQFAKKMGVSASFVSQLFTAEKTVSMEFLAKAQDELKIKFSITAERQNQEASLDAILEKFLKIEKAKTDQNEEDEEDEEGFWVYYNKKKPDYTEKYPAGSETKLAPVA